MKWRLAGEPHTGPISWSDSLAFSPDGTRLAAYRSLAEGPSVPSSAPSTDRRSNRFKPLKMLSLEPGSSTPTVTILEKGGIPLPARLEWPGDGGTLILRRVLAFDTFDPTTGRSKEVFEIPFPKSVAEPTDADLSVSARPGDAAKNTGQLASDIPQGLLRPASQTPARARSTIEYLVETKARSVPMGRVWRFISTSRRVTHPTTIVDAPRAKGVTENRVAIWDVGTRRLIGIIRLPDGPSPILADPTQRWKTKSSGGLADDRADQTPTTENKAKDRPNALALSGDGQRLAVSDADGTVHVYDTTRLSGSNAVQANAPTKAPDNASAPQIAAIRSAFEDSLQRARNRLLGKFRSSDRAARTIHGQFRQQVRGDNLGHPEGGKTTVRKARPDSLVGTDVESGRRVSQFRCRRAGDGSRRNLRSGYAH